MKVADKAYIYNDGKVMMRGLYTWPAALSVVKCVLCPFSLGVAVQGLYLYLYLRYL